MDRGQSRVMSSDTIYVDPEKLRSFARALLEQTGLHSDYAETIADALVKADLRGVNSHGVARLDAYLENLDAGGFNTNPDITVERSGDATVLVDGDDAPGQIAAIEGTKAAIEVAAESGAGLVSVQNSNHFGTAAYYTEYMADHGCIGLSMTNVDAEVIPFGGREPFLGTNPLSVAFPTPGSIPITLDMATSVVAMGKVDHVAAEEGESIPEHWAVDSQGRTTMDASEVHALRPAAGPKGYGLGLTVDLLSGVLSDSEPSINVGNLYGDYDEPMQVGHFFGAVDVSFFRDVKAYEADIEAYIEKLKCIETESGVDEVMLPGEIEARTMEQNLERGVPIIDGVAENLRMLSDDYGVAIPDAFQTD